MMHRAAELQVISANCFRLRRIASREARVKESLSKGGAFFV